MRQAHGRVRVRGPGPGEGQGRGLQGKQPLQEWREGRRGPIRRGVRGGHRQDGDQAREGVRLRVVRRQQGATVDFEAITCTVAFGPINADCAAANKDKATCEGKSTGMCAVEACAATCKARRMTASRPSARTRSKGGPPRQRQEVQGGEELGDVCGDGDDVAGGGRGGVQGRERRGRGHGADETKCKAVKTAANQTVANQTVATACTYTPANKYCLAGASSNAKGEEARGLQPDQKTRRPPSRSLKASMPRLEMPMPTRRSHQAHTSLMCGGPGQRFVLCCLPQAEAWSRIAGSTQEMALVTCTDCTS